VNRLDPARSARDWIDLEVRHHQKASAYEDSSPPSPRSRPSAPPARGAPTAKTSRPDRRARSTPWVRRASRGRSTGSREPSSRSPERSDRNRSSGGRAISRSSSALGTRSAAGRREDDEDGHRQVRNHGRPPTNRISPPTPSQATTRVSAGESVRNNPPPTRIAPRHTRRARSTPAKNGLSVNLVGEAALAGATSARPASTPTRRTVPRGPGRGRMTATSNEPAQAKRSSGEVGRWTRCGRSRASRPWSPDRDHPKADELEREHPGWARHPPSCTEPRAERRRLGRGSGPANEGGGAREGYDQRHEVDGQGGTQTNGLDTRSVLRTSPPERRPDGTAARAANDLQTIDGVND
jgi:hypothetical protein